jgi:deoxyribonuclease V
MVNHDDFLWDGSHPAFSTRKARELQEKIGRQVVANWDGRHIRRVAGADVAYNRNGWATAAVAVLEYPGMAVTEVARASGMIPCPYIPGLFSFRETPPLLRAFEKIETPVDVILCDGHGIAHRKRCGLASHVGVLLKTPAIGCAKSRLYGQYRDPSPRRGSRASLRDSRGHIIGAALRTRTGKKPVFVSPGHLIDLRKAIEIVLTVSPRYRIPEPIRLAHQYAVDK